MRISDWSSDVCSSDLRTGRHLWPFECLRLTGSGRGRDGLLLCRVRKALDRRCPGWGVGGFLHQRRCDGLWEWFEAERTFPQNAADDACCAPAVQIAKSGCRGQRRDTISHEIGREQGRERGGKSGGNGG